MTKSYCPNSFLPPALSLAIATIALIAQTAGAQPANTSNTAPQHSRADLLYPFPATLDLDIITRMPVSQAMTTAPVLWLVPPRISDRSEEQFPSLGKALGDVLRFHLMVSIQGKPRFNLVTQTIINLPYDDHTTRVLVTLQTEEVLIRDARSLQADLLVIPRYDGTPESGTLSYRAINLRTQETTDGSQTVSGGNISEALRGLIRDSGRLMGWTDQAMTEARLLDDMIKPQDWVAIATGPAETMNERIRVTLSPATREAAAFVLLNSATGDVPLSRLNDAIRSAPWDTRMVIAKMFSMSQQWRKYREIPLLLARVLSRIEPGNYLYLESISVRIIPAFRGDTGAAVAPTPGMMAIGKDASDFFESSNGSWGAAYIASKTWEKLAWVARGAETADKIPKESSDKFYEWTGRAMGYLEKCRGSLGDFSSRLICDMAGLRSHTQAGPDYQTLMRLSYQANPRDPRTALAVAYYNSVGWGDVREYRKLIKWIHDRHRGDPVAESLIFAEIAQNLRRTESLRNMSADEVIKQEQEVIKIAITILREGYPQAPVSVTNPQFMITLRACVDQKALDAALNLTRGSLRPYTAINYVGLLESLGLPIEPDPNILNEAWNFTMDRVTKDKTVDVQVLHHMKVMRPLFIPAMVKAGRTEELLNQLQRAIELVPTDTENHLAFAQVSSQNSVRTEKGLAHAQAVLKLQPENSRAKILVDRLSAKAR